MKFSIIKTNIVNIEADAIVLPANEALKEGAGTSTAIFEAAGRKKLTKACKEIGHCNVGSAVPTLAYNLDAKYIIHAVVPKWIDGQHNEYDLLSSAYLAALNIADVMECESIAFPILASGNNGFDSELAIHIAQESIESFEGSSLKKVTLVAYGDAMEKTLNQLGYSVVVLPDNIQKQAKKLAHQVRFKRILADGKDTAEQILLDQMEKAVEWMKEPENRDRIIQLGKTIFKAVTEKAM